MNIITEPGRHPQELIVRLEGDLDLYASVAFATEVMGHLDRGTRRLLLNFKHVRYLDSSGVGALIRLLQKTRATGGELKVAELSGTPRKVLEMSNILSILKTYPDEATARVGWESA